MRRVTDFRKNAQDCRDLARKMPRAQRQQLLDMADQWDRLAEDRLLAANDEPETWEPRG